MKRQARSNNMSIDRRRFLQGTSAMAGIGIIAAPALAQAKTKIRIGYLHTLAVDGQMWLAEHLGSFDKNGLDPEFKLFQTGLELFQAMIGGSLDMLSTGAVISNFPARGQGKMFLANAVEFATAQLWVRDDIKSFADLKGKRIATTAGTTAHVFLSTAMRANNLAAADVEILNQRMPDASPSFSSVRDPPLPCGAPSTTPVGARVRPGRTRPQAASKSSIRLCPTPSPPSSRVRYLPLPCGSPSTSPCATRCRPRESWSMHPPTIPRPPSCRVGPRRPISTASTARCWCAWSRPGRRPTSI